jgi:holin, phage phi LC3 family
MRINWKQRFRNGAWLPMFLGALVTTGYMICDTFGIKIPIPQNDVTKIITAILGLLGMLGVITDPTTKGFSDSARAMSYGVPTDKLNTSEIEKGLRNAEVLDNGNTRTDS